MCVGSNSKRNAVNNFLSVRQERKEETENLVRIYPQSFAVTAIDEKVIVEILSDLNQVVPIHLADKGQTR